jgi:hypothetical protein
MGRRRSKRGSDRPAPEPPGRFGATTPSETGRTTSALDADDSRSVLDGVAA